MYNRIYLNLCMLNDVCWLLTSINLCLISGDKVSYHYTGIWPHTPTDLCFFRVDQLTSVLPPTTTLAPTTTEDTPDSQENYLDTPDYQENDDIYEDTEETVEEPKFSRN